MNKEFERRNITAPVKIETRADGDNQTEVIQGIAAKINERTLIGSKKWGFYEKIAPGAFDDVLEDDVRCLFNHDPSKILSRTKSGTLEVFVNEDGHFAYRSNIPNRSYATDLQDALQTGDVDGSSFGFIVGEYSWRWAEDHDDLDVDERTIIKFSKILDVSPVTYPAYEATSSGVAKRSLDAWQDAKKEASEVRNEDVNKLSTEKNKAFEIEAELRYKHNKNKLIR